MYIISAKDLAKQKKALKENKTLTPTERAAAKLIIKRGEAQRKGNVKESVRLRNSK